MSENQAQEAEPPVREIKTKFAFDLDNMSVEELTALRDAAENKRREALEGAKQEALREFTEKLQRLGLSIQDALPRARSLSSPSPAGQAASGTRKMRRNAGRPLPVKFRGPNGEKWSGRGREPRWMQALEATGRKREEFRV
jgi:DNA-binding protein H-NS